MKELGMINKRLSSLQSKGSVLFIMFCLLATTALSLDIFSKGYKVTKYKTTVTYGYAITDDLLEVNCDVSTMKTIMSTRPGEEVEFKDFIFTNHFSELKEVSFQKYSIEDQKKKSSKKRRKGLKMSSVPSNVNSFNYNDENYFHNDYTVNEITAQLYGAQTVFIAHYLEHFSDVKFFPQLDLIGSDQCDERVVEIVYPKNLSLDIESFNFEGFEIDTQEKIMRNDSIVYLFTMKDVDRFAKQNYTPNPKFIYPHIRLNVTQVNANGKVYDYIQNMDDLYAWYTHLNNEIKNDTAGFKALVDKITQNTTSQEQELNAIYQYVQENIKYIAFEDGLAGFKPEACNRVLEQKYGDCKGMANLLKHMYLSKGYDARLAWIGTRNAIPYDYSSPSLANDNHMICALYLNDTVYFIDGTERFNTIDQLGFRIQGRPVLIENGEGYTISQVPDLSIDSDLIENHVQVSLNKQSDRLMYHAQKKLDGEEKRSLAYFYNYLASAEREDFMYFYLKERDSDKIKINEIRLGSRQENGFIDYAVENNNNLIILSDAYYVKLLRAPIFEVGDTNSVREFGWSFNEKTNTKGQVIFDIPTGHSVESVPESSHYKNDEFDFEISYKIENNQVILNYHLIVQNGFIHKENNEEWFKVIDRILKANDEYIIINRNV